MQSNHSDLLNEVAEYYTSKLIQFGDTPQGVDWNGATGQILRFEQLCKIIATNDPFTINDLGCGYGALFDFIAQKTNAFTYSGFDISEEMIRTAKKRHQSKPNARFILANEPDQIADFTMASGIFNVRFKRSENEWKHYFEETLNLLDQKSSRGFAFNCLTAYSDANKMRDNLFYADPCAVFDLCKKHYSRHVALLHDYGLYEFTILVRKS